MEGVYDSKLSMMLTRSEVVVGIWKPSCGGRGVVLVGAKPTHLLFAEPGCLYLYKLQKQKLNS